MSFGQTPGSLDLTFGSGTGFVTTNVTDSANYGRAVSIQSDGKIVVTGYGKNGAAGLQNFATTRYNANGSLDNTFGKIITNFGGGDATAYATAIQSDGKIIVAGATIGFALVRYNTNGTLDAGFGTSGKVTTPLGGYAIIYAVAIQADGKIVVAGSKTVSNISSFALARYNSNGSLDNTFNTTGYVTTSIGSAGSAAFALAIQTDGKILATGFTKTTNRDIAIIRYNANGSLDNTFNSTGIVTTSIGSSDEQAQSIALQSEGKIVVTGRSNNGSDYDFALIRYNTNGSLDNTFNTSGIVTTPVGSSQDGAYSVAIQTNGKIVAAGYSYNGTDNDFAVVTYNSNGSVDNTFGTNGIVKTQIGTSDNAAYALALQADGKIVVAGYAKISSLFGPTYGFAVARYNTDISIGIEDLDENNGIKVFPNPATERISIIIDQSVTFSNPVLSLYNIYGQLLIENVLTSEKSEIDISKLAKGVYVIKFNRGNKMAFSRIIKE